MSATPEVPAPQPQRPFGSKWTYAVLAIALLFVLMPFLFWNATWFGRPMGDAQITKSLADHSRPREIQHALSLVEARMEKNDPSARQWYPQIVALAGDQADEIRLTAAWVMGQDTSVPEFHEALRPLLNDPQPMVQCNAALSLVRFGDDSGHELILSMLKPYDIRAPEAGTVIHRLRLGDVINPGTLLGYIRVGNEKREVRSAVPGTLDSWLAGNDASVAAGEPIVRLDPGAKVVWEALRALSLVGKLEDLRTIEPYARGVAGMPPAIAQQAALTMQAIRSRRGP